MLISMHRFIYPLMGGVAFPFNELMDFIFLIGLPYGFAWVFEKIPNLVVRHAAIGGAGIGVVLSYWLQSDLVQGKFNVLEYCLELVKCLTAWSYQDWGRTLAFVWPVFAAAGICALLCAVIANYLPTQERAATV
jgi:hypothetical protein